jgi:hypothetical protein
MKKKLIKVVFGVLLFVDQGHGSWEKNEEGVVNSSETWCWRGILKIKWTDSITNDEVFQRAKEKRLILKIKKK